MLKRKGVIVEAEVKTNILGNLATKLIACLFILICLAVGVVGLILPIIPGILFLAIAAMVAARMCPPLDRWLRKSRTMNTYLESSHGFLSLSFWGKVQYTGWLFMKVFIDSIIFIIAISTKLFSFALNKSQYHR
jgi:uncharacterized membrane protein YbaN (DUF454 family)